jgi:hypothetical protein
MLEHISSIRSRLARLEAVRADVIARMIRSPAIDDELRMTTRVRALFATMMAAAVACGARNKETASEPITPVVVSAPAPRVDARDADAGKALETTDPRETKDADAYAAQLATFFHSRWMIPKSITPDQTKTLCVVFQVNVSRNMVLWHVRANPLVSSGNEELDDSVRSMLQGLVDDRTQLPPPPPALDDVYRGRSVAIALTGDPHGDTSRCNANRPP